MLMPSNFHSFKIRICQNNIKIILKLIIDQNWIYMYIFMTHCVFHRDNIRRTFKKEHSKIYITCNYMYIINY